MPSKGMDRVLALAPDSLNVKIQRAYMEFFWKGSTAPIKAALESFAPNLDPDGVVTFSRWDVSLMDRDVTAAEKALAACQLNTIASQTGVPLPKSYLQACVDLVRGDADQGTGGVRGLPPWRLKRQWRTARKTAPGGRSSDYFTRF